MDAEMQELTNLARQQRCCSVRQLEERDRRWIWKTVFSLDTIVCLEPAQFKEIDLSYWEIRVRVPV
jgi:hypothetical protein